MAFADVWRRKSDEQLLAASRVLEEYEEGARVAILDELRRRQDDGTLSTDLTVSASAAPEAHPVEGSLLRRLWHGDVPLRQTFWVAGLATNLAFRVGLVILASLPRNGLVETVAIALALVYMAYLVFSAVAIWRSAGQYRGAPSWRNLARLWVILSALQLVVNAIAVSR